MKFGQLAQKLLPILGTQTLGTLRRTTISGHNATTGKPNATVLDYLCPVVLSTPSTNMFDANVVQNGDMTVQLSARDITVTPLPGDVFVVGDNTFHIVTLVPHYEKDTAYMFTLLVRK